MLIDDATNLSVFSPANEENSMLPPVKKNASNKSTNMFSGLNHENAVDNGELVL